MVQMGKLRHGKRKGRRSGSTSTSACPAQTWAGVLSSPQWCLLSGSFLTPDLELEDVNGCHIITGCSLGVFPLILDQRAARRNHRRREEMGCRALRVLGWRGGCLALQRRHLHHLQGRGASPQLGRCRFQAAAISPVAAAASCEGGESPAGRCVNQR